MGSTRNSTGSNSAMKAWRAPYDTIVPGAPSARRPSAGTSAEALRGHAAMLTFAAIISGSFSLGHAGGLGIDPGALTTARFLIAIFAMAAIVLAAGEVREARVTALALSDPRRPARDLFRSDVRRAPADRSGEPWGCSPPPR